MGNREIKFRAWYKERMLYNVFPTGVSYILYHKTGDDPRGNNIMQLDSGSPLILTQYLD